MRVGASSLADALMQRPHNRPQGLQQHASCIAGLDCMGVLRPRDLVSQDQQQHFQRPEAEDAAIQQGQATVQSSGDQLGSRGSSRPAARPQMSGEGDGSREHSLASAQPQDAAGAPLSAQDAEWEDWKAVRCYSSLSARVG